MSHQPPGDRNLACNHCWNDIGNQATILSIPCRHIFCHNCASQWFQTNNQCPFCNRELTNKKMELRQVSQNVQDRAIQFCGMHPRKIMEAANYAIMFWEQQRVEYARKSGGELDHYRAGYEKSKDMISSMETELKRRESEIIKLRDENRMLKDTIASNRERSHSSERYKTTFTTSNPSTPVNNSFIDSSYSSSKPSTKRSTSNEFLQMNESFFPSSSSSQRGMVPFDSRSRQSPSSAAFNIMPGGNISPATSSRFVASATPRTEPWFSRSNHRNAMKPFR